MLGRSTPLAPVLLVASSAQALATRELDRGSCERAHVLRAAEEPHG